MERLRRNRAFVCLASAPASIKEAAEVETTLQAGFSRREELINHVSHIGGKYGTFEPNFWRLDGTFMIAPNTNERLTTPLELGFTGRSLSNHDGFYPGFEPEIVIRFATPQNLELVSMVFDMATGEVIDTARFRVFNPGGAVIFEETIRDNREMVMATSRGASNVGRVVITIFRSATPRRRPRVAEVHFGPVMMFDGEDILNVNNLREADAGAKSFPTNRLRVRVLNKGRFSLLDAGGDLSFLKEKLLVEHTQGIGNGDNWVWMHCGTFFLHSWAVKENYLELMAYGRSWVLSKSVYRDSSFMQFSLADIARHIAADAGVKVEVNRGMEYTPWFPRFMGNVSHKAALNMVAELGSYVLHEDRFGVLHFLDMTTQDWWNRFVISEHLDFERMFAAPKVGMKPYYNGIILKEYFLTLEHSPAMTTAVDVWGAENITIPFDRPIFSGGRAIASWGFTLTDVRFSPMHMTARLSGHGRCTIEINGHRAVFASGERFFHAPWFSAGEERQAYVVDLPMFLSNLQFINYMRNWVVRRKFEMLAKRTFCDVEWRQNPFVNPADWVNVQMLVDGRTMTGHVMRQELEFDRGVLRGSSGVIIS